MDDNLGRKVLSYRWLIFGIMASAYLAAFFHRVCPAVIALDIQETYGISAELIGLLASAYFYSYAFIQFPAGLLSDSFGPRKSVTLFIMVGALGSILFGLAPNLETALVGRVLVGLGAGMVFTPTMKILSSWFRVNEFTKMNSIFLATGGLGALSAAALAEMERLRAMPSDEAWPPLGTRIPTPLFAPGVRRNSNRKMKSPYSCSVYRLPGLPAASAGSTIRRPSRTR